ncbi:MAG: hypothetical protein FJX35_04085 [Alphaproteobacteria bacterium]|nr:hypothetical protein [Alphaproteobacteria bacterium]
MRATIAAMLVLMAASACGFEPLYATRGGRSAADGLSEIKVNVISDRLGQQLRNELLDRLNPYGAAARPRYALDVSLRETRTELDLRRDATSTFSKFEIAADFALTDLQSGQVVLRGNSRSTTSITLLRQTFANLSAAEDARQRGVREISEDMRVRLADFMARRSAG